MTASLCSSFRPASRVSASAASDAATSSRVAAQLSDRSAMSIGRTLATAHDGFGGTAGSVGEWAYHRPVEPVDRREFEALVADALDTLPPDLTGLMDNVVVLTADRGDPPDLCEGVCKKKQHRGARARGHGQPFARTGPRQQLGAP